MNGAEGLQSIAAIVLSGAGINTAAVAWLIWQVVSIQQRLAVMSERIDWIRAEVAYANGVDAPKAAAD